MLVKSKLNTIEVLISKPLIDSNISQILDVLKEFYDMKEEIKNSNYKWKLYIKQIKQSCIIVWSVEKMQKVKFLKL